MRFVERAQAPQWEVVYESKDNGTKWQVGYAPKLSNVRGGAGVLTVDKETGRITLIRGFK